MFTEMELKGIEKYISHINSLFRLILIIGFVLISFTTILSLYIIVIVFLALFLPTIAVSSSYSEQITKMATISKYLLYTITLILGVLLYPVWLILCIVPGTCKFGPKIYPAILFLVYN